MNLYINIFLLLGLAVAAGEIFARIKQVPLIGQVLIGIIIGPSVLGIITYSSAPSLMVISDIAVFFLMFIAGLELDIKEVWKESASSIVIAITMFVIPYIIGYTVFFYVLKYSYIVSMFIALCLAMSALPVASMILHELDIYNTTLGTKIMSTSTFKDIISMFVLSIILMIYTYHSISINLILDSILKIIIFLGVVILVYLLILYFKIIPLTIGKLLKKLKSREIIFALLLVTSLAISVFAQDMGMSFITGTFFSGLIITDESTGKKQYNDLLNILSPVTYGFFAPLFFAILGVEFILSGLIDDFLIFLIMIIIAIGAKILGGYIGSKAVKQNSYDSLMIGSVCTAGGVLELVVASIGYSSGIISDVVFSLLVANSILTSILAPIIAGAIKEKVHVIKNVKGAL
ncbi:MAG: cation:proton antiporter [Thermoplasmata archaeon]